MPTKLSNTKINLIREGDVGFVNDKWTVKNRVEIQTLSDGTQKEFDPFVRGISESRVFRMFGSENFFIFACNRKSTRSKMLQILSEGIHFEGKLWLPVINSASELRGQKGLFTCLDRDLVRKQITFGADFRNKDGKVSMPKKVSYTGLGSSTTKESNLKFTYRHIEDVVKKTPVEVMLFNPETETFEEKIMEVSITYTDGGGYISLAMAVKLATELKLDYIPSAFQVRFGGEKGLLLVWDWDKSLERIDPIDGVMKNHDADILFFQSMHKFSIDSSYDHNADHERDASGNIIRYMPRLEICSHTKPRRSDSAYLCYQYIQAMPQFTFDDIKQLTDEALTKVDNVLTDINACKIFLGLFSSPSEDVSQDEENENLVSKITKTIHADEKMLFDPYIQMKLKSLLEKYVLDMRKGRIPVQGAYQYIFSDPQAYFGIPMLKSGQTFWNNIDGEAIAFRAPLIHAGEVNSLLLYTVDELSDVPDFMKQVFKIKGFEDFTYGWDIIIFNTHDDNLLKAGTADTDGDKMLITMLKRFIDAYKYFPFTMSSLVRKGKLVNDDEYNYVAFLLDSYCSTSKIGEYVNYSTVWKDMPYNLPHIANQADYAVRRLSIDVVDEIDSVKTGFKPNVPDHIKIMNYPHWMEINVGKSDEQKVKEYQSLSPLGQNYDYVATKWAEIRNRVLTTEQSFKKSLQLISIADPAVYNEILPIITRYEKQYRMDMATINRLETAGRISPDIASLSRSRVCEDYRELVESIDADLVTTAVACYVSTYANREGGSSSYSFPWITSFDGLLFAIAMTSESRNKLYRVRFTDADVIPYHGMSLTFINGKDEIMSARVAKIVPDGQYQVIENDGNFYISFENNEVLIPKLEHKVPTVSSIQFSIRGFNHYGLNAKQVIDLLAKNNGTCYCQLGQEYITLYTDTSAGLTAIATVAKQDDYTVSKVANMQLQVKNLDMLQPTYVSKRTNTVQYAGNLSLVCSVVSSVEFETESQDETDLITSELLELGISVESFDENSFIFGFNGASYTLPLSHDGMRLNVAVELKNPEIKALIESYINA